MGYPIGLLQQTSFDTKKTLSAKQNADETTPADFLATINRAHYYRSSQPGHSFLPWYSASRIEAKKVYMTPAGTCLLWHYQSFRKEAHKDFASPGTKIVLVFSVEWSRLKTVCVQVRKYSQHQKDQKKMSIKQFGISKVSILWIHARNEFTVDNYVLINFSLDVVSSNNFRTRPNMQHNKSLFLRSKFLTE